MAVHYCMIECIPDRSSAKVLEGLARWTRRASAMRDYTLTKQSKRAVLTSDQLFLPFQETHWKPTKPVWGKNHILVGGNSPIPNIIMKDDSGWVCIASQRELFGSYFLVYRTV